MLYNKVHSERVGFWKLDLPDTCNSRMMRIRNLTRIVADAVTNVLVAVFVLSADAVQPALERYCHEIGEPSVPVNIRLPVVNWPGLRLNIMNSVLKPLPVKT